MLAIRTTTRIPSIGLCVRICQFCVHHRQRCLGNTPFYHRSKTLSTTRVLPDTRYNGGHEAPLASKQSSPVSSCKRPHIRTTQTGGVVQHTRPQSGPPTGSRPGTRELASTTYEEIGPPTTAPKIWKHLSEEKWENLSKEKWRVKAEQVSLKLNTVLPDTMLYPTALEACVRVTEPTTDVGHNGEVYNAPSAYPARKTTSEPLITHKSIKNPRHKTIEKRSAYRAYIKQTEIFNAHVRHTGKLGASQHCQQRREEKGHDRDGTISDVQQDELDLSHLLQDADKTLKMTYQRPDSYFEPDEDHGCYFVNPVAAQRRGISTETEAKAQERQQDGDPDCEAGREIPKQNKEGKRKKTIAESDRELQEKMAGHVGDGGEAGVEYEDGKPVAMKRGVRENMFRYI